MDSRNGLPLGDLSNGYERAAEAYMAERGKSEIGVATVRAWASSLPPGGSILDIGCGNGMPISHALIEDGFSVFGVDASTTMTATFGHRFPQAQVICEAVERSRFFSRGFEGVIAWGLMFLLPAEAQPSLIRNVAAVLNPGGRFLFTSPEQACTWADLLTGRPSVSLGSAVYKAVLRDAGLTLVGEHQDDGDNHYYNVAKV